MKQSLAQLLSQLDQFLFSSKLGRILSKFLMVVGLIFIALIVFAALSTESPQNTDDPTSIVTPAPSVSITTPTDSTPTPIVAPVAMELQIRYSHFEPGFSVPVITIKNLNDFIWQDCETEINNSYYKTLPSIYLPSTFREWNSDKGYHTIATTWFVRRNGTIFNPATTRPMSVCVTCQQPRFDVFCGKFRN